MGIDVLNIVLFYLNVIYYWEFIDFMMIVIMIGYFKVNQGLLGSLIVLINFYDVFYWLDIVVILVLMFFCKIKFDLWVVSYWVVFVFILVVLVVFGVNLVVVEMDWF